jgi:hypothetical protein
VQEVSARFASLTADLLVRKGDARPSAIAAPEAFAFNAALVDGTQQSIQKTADRADNRSFPIGIISVKKEPRVPEPSEQPVKLHRLVLTLSAKEHEVIGLIAVKEGTSRNALLRQALNDYLAPFVHNCHGKCHCISSGYSGQTCSPLSTDAEATRKSQ